MISVGLVDFFNSVGYDWKKDEDEIKTICHYTKTRVNPKILKTRLTWGVEQTFLVKAIAEWHKASNFFEIGTGRGTACYALSLIPEIKEIHTVDILKFNQKFSTAIGHKPALVSLKDIKNMIPFKEKNKINFHVRKEFSDLRKKFSNIFDLAFIDGDHTDEKTILEDYSVCCDILKPGGLILWDDYDPDKFSVKKIVDMLCENDNKLDTILVEQRGHLFSDKPPEYGKGVVIMKFGKI